MRSEQELKMLFEKFDRDVLKRPRWYRWLLTLDQMGNVLFMNGSQDETISSHIHRKQVAGTATRINNGVCWVLNKLEDKHCLKSKGE